MEHEKINEPKRKCAVAFCAGPEKCVVMEMMQNAPDTNDLYNTFKTIGPECRLANNPKLIRLYNRRLAELGGESA